MKALRLTAATCILFSLLLTSSDAFLIRQRIGDVGSLFSKGNPATVETEGNTTYDSNSLRISKVGRSRLSAHKSEASDDSGGEKKPASILSDRSLGILVLLTVPLSWGTYTPVVKYLYEIQPPVPGFVFSACYYALAAVTTSTIALRQTRTKKESDSKDTSDDSLSTTTTSTRPTSSWPVRGGLELGSYLFIANCLQVVGLQTVASDRAGFLVQLTTVMVPFVEALFAGNLLEVPLKTWFACILAFLGLFVMGLDGKAALLTNPIATFATALLSFSRGDLLIVGAAVLYTLHVVRLGRYAKETAPMKLAAAKATSEAIFGVILVGGLAGLASTGMAATGGLLGFAVETGKDILSFFSLFTTGIATGAVPKSALISALGATLWTGWVTCAYTIYAQSFGQSRVSPTNANLIYTFQPIFTALFAFILLGETMGPAGFAGGGIIGLAVYLVASSYNDASSKKDVLDATTEETLLINGETLLSNESNSTLIGEKIPR